MTGLRTKPPALVFLCRTCQVESSDTACDLCGRQLTANDLVPMTSNAPAAHLAASTAGASTKGE